VIVLCARRAHVCGVWCVRAVLCCVSFVICHIVARTHVAATPLLLLL
jgi:hypothetical protein